MLHVGKTGGTAIKHALRHAMPPPGTVVVMHGHEVRLADIPADDEVFFVLRDPLSRYVSGFNSRLREGRPRYSYPWTAAERRAFAQFSTPDELATALSADDDARRRQARRAMREIGHVRWHYDHWLGDPGVLRARAGRVVVVGMQETLATDFERLKGRLGLSADVRLPRKDKAAHRSPADVDTYLSPVAVANLREWYADDYVLLAAAVGVDAGRGDRTLQGR